MPIFVIVNAFADVTSRQTTSLLAASASRLGQETIVAEVGAVTAKSNGKEVEYSIHGLRLAENVTTSEQVAAATASVPSSLERFNLTTSDIVLIRTNPGRDPSRQALHESFLQLMLLAEAIGVRVINRPGNLVRFASKSSLLMLDSSLRPETIVTTRKSEVYDFVRAATVDCVVKPLFGSRGHNVLRVASNQDDLHSLLCDNFGNQPIVAQQFVHADHPGDRRILVLDGKILESNGGIAGIERHPAAGDFRGNLHAGGSAHPLSLNDMERHAVSRAAQLLFKNGIRFAGVDIIGDQIIEFNVFSAGGLFDGNRFAKTDFSEIVVQSFLQ